MPLMAVESVQLATASLIIGCGYLGRVLAEKLLDRGGRVYGLVRSESSAERLAHLGVQALVGDVTQKLMLAAALKPALAEPQLDVYHLVPPGRPRGEGDAGPSPRQVLIDGSRHLHELLEPARVRRAVMTSSTGVYGQNQGEYVDADTPPQPGDERARLLLEAEQVWLGSGLDVYVVRLAGIYGPGRIVGLHAVRQGAPLAGNPQGWLNLIHVSDAADLLIAVMSAAQPGRIELGSDGLPVPRIEYYEYVARHGAAPPVRLLDARAMSELGVSSARLRSASSKRCDNVVTCRRTGWLPRYPTYRDGLKAIFAKEQTCGD
jgi:nucleoside-diphosphate-sugar epimerase